MTNKGKTKDALASLKKEVDLLKEKLNSVSESELSRDIETQKFKIHDIERTSISISWLLHESKKSVIISIILPLLLAFIAFGFAQSIIANFSFISDVLEQSGAQEVGYTVFDFSSLLGMLNMVPLIVFIVAYVGGLKITSIIAGTIVKHRILKREKNKLRMLESH